MLAAEFLDLEANVKWCLLFDIDEDWNFKHDRLIDALQESLYLAFSHAK